MKNKLLLLITMALCSLSLTSCGESRGKRYYETAQSHFENDVRKIRHFQSGDYSKIEVYVQKHDNGDMNVAVKFNYKIKYVGLKDYSTATEKGVCYSIFSDYDISINKFHELHCSMCSAYLENDDDLLFEYIKIQNRGEKYYSKKW